MKFFQKYKDRKESRIKEEKAKQELSLKDARSELEKSTNKMLSSPCTIRSNLGCCFSECVHWQQGNVYFYPFYESDDGFYYSVNPSCKLWGKK